MYFECDNIQVYQGEKSQKNNTSILYFLGHKTFLVLAFRKQTDRFFDKEMLKLRTIGVWKGDFGNFFSIGNYSSFVTFNTTVPFVGR